MRKSVLVPYEKYLILTKHLSTNENNNNNNYDATCKTLPPPPPTLTTTDTPTAAADKCTQNSCSLSCDVILSYLPQKIRRKSESLLNEICKSNEIRWCPRGLVFINEKPTETHICDFLHFANCAQKKEPAGAGEFFEKIKHLPSTLISNSNARALSQQQQQQQQGSGTTAQSGAVTSSVIPPGIPDKSKKPRAPKATWKQVWKPL